MKRRQNTARFLLNSAITSDLEWPWGSLQLLHNFPDAPSQKLQNNTDIVRDRQRDRQTDTETDWPTDRQTDRQRGRQTDIQRGRQTDLQTDRQTHSQRGRQTDRHRIQCITSMADSTKVLCPQNRFSRKLQRYKGRMSRYVDRWHSCIWHQHLLRLLVTKSRRFRWRKQITTFHKITGNK